MEVKASEAVAAVAVSVMKVVSVATEVKVARTEVTEGRQEWLSNSCSEDGMLAQTMVHSEVLVVLVVEREEEEEVFLAEADTALEAEVTDEEKDEEKDVKEATLAAVEEAMETHEVAIPSLVICGDLVKNALNE